MIISHGKQFPSVFSENFMPYIEVSYQETLKLVEYGNNEVTKSSLKALTNFAIAVFDYNKKMGDETSATGMCVNVVRFNFEFTKPFIG